MSQQQPGWFPDPYGTGSQRYWDGVRWTPHTQAPGTHVAAAGASPAGSGTDPTLSLPQQPSTTPDLPAFPAGSAYGGYPTTLVPSAGIAGGYAPTSNYPGATHPFAIADPTYYEGQNSPARKSRTGLAIGLGVVSAAVVGTGVWFGLSLLDGSDSDAASSPTPTTAASTAPSVTPTVTTDPTSADAPTGAAAPATGTVALPLDELITGNVPAGGTYAATFEVVAEGVYVLSTLAPDGVADLVMSLSDANGTVIAQGDDLPAAGSIMGGGLYDPLLTVSLTAGVYSVNLTEYDGLAADFDIAVLYAQTKGALFPDTFDVQLEAEYYWIGWIDIPEGGTLTVDAIATTDSDLAAVIMAPNGTYWENDDRSGSDKNPYVSAPGLSAGRYVVLVSEYYWESADLSVTISTQ